MNDIIRIPININGQDALLTSREIEFFRNRTIRIDEPIIKGYGNYICSLLMYLDRESEDDITLIINSPGGEVSEGLAILDVMQSLKSDVNTIVCGMAASMSAVILSAGKKRYATENSEIMLHQPLGGAQGQASEIEIAAKHILLTKEKLNNIIAKNCNRSLKDVVKATDRDNWLSAREGIKFGIIDEIVTEW